MLYVHDRQTRTRELPAAQIQALSHAFFADERSESDLAQARGLLTDLHNARAWLACDCASGPDDTWPMIGPRAGRGGMHPFRFGQVGHRHDCPFASAIRHPESASSTDAEDDTGPIDGDWHLASLFPRGQAPDGRRVAMSRLLRTALAALGFERLHISAFDPKARSTQMRLLETPFSRLRHLGAQPMGEGRSFHDVGLTFLPALPRWLREVAARVPADAGVGGLYLGVIDTVAAPDRSDAAGFLTARDARGERRTFPIRGTVFLPEGDNGVLGPYWALALVVGDGAGRWRLGDTLVLPALDRRTLLPVPSAAHRGVAALLLEQMQFWRSWKKLGVEVELAAPLFPSPYPAAPAFALVLPNQARVNVDLESSPSRSDGGVLVPTSDHDPNGTRRRLTAAVARAMTAPAA